MLMIRGVCITTFNRGATTAISVEWEACLYNWPIFAGLRELQSLLIARNEARFGEKVQLDN
jgi:hypothetical protein